MNKQDYIKEQIRDWRERYKHHVAKVLAAQISTTITLIEWRHPLSWSYGMRFIMHSSWLCVIGDVCEATYQWSDAITPAFLRGLDFGYFRSKCKASPTGRNWDEFDQEVGLSELRSCDDPMVIEYPAIREVIDSGKFPDKDTWDLMCQEVYDHAGDAELASMLSQMPMVPDCMQVGHFVGVQMALEQLKLGDTSCTTKT